MLDVVIVSYAKDHELYNVTMNAIDSLIKSEQDIDINIIVIESNKDIFYPGNCLTVHPDIPFNYNAYLKIGLTYCKYDWVALCNNDLIFYKHWFSEIADWYNNSTDKSIKSFSPWNRHEDWHYNRVKDDTQFIGYSIGVQLCGWCIVARTEIFDRVDLSSDVNFWCSDNIYADELIKHGIKHRLQRFSFVDHLTSRTLFTMPSEKIKELTSDQGVIYANRCRDNY